jgi:hypothetical protein
MMRRLRLRVEGSLKRRGLRIKAAAENLGRRLAVAAAPRRRIGDERAIGGIVAASVALTVASFIS